MTSQVLRGGAPLPTGPYALLPLRAGTLFPGVTQTFSVGRKKSITLIHSLHVGDIVVVVPQRSPKPKQPKSEELYPFGTFARVVQTVRLSDNSYQLGLEGLGRFVFHGLTQTEPFYKADGSLLEESTNDPREARLLAEALLSQVAEVKRNGGALGELPQLGTDPGDFADRVAAALELTVEQAVELLGQPEVGSRLRRVIEILGEIRTTAELRTKIASDVRAQFGKQQRDAILREQLRAIKKELGDDEQGADSALHKRLSEAEFPEEVQAVVDRELRRLETTGQSAEGNVIRNYLDWIAALPWQKRAPVSDDIDAIGTRLEADHFGMEDVKKRILEHMAVYKLSGNPRGTILALVGPPGVGKTSLGQSIAESTGRPLVRIALGGVRDEAEVRGHRRTYVGAMPGRVLHALRKAGVKNPIILLDELDKLGTGWGGSPEAALLEVLDPEQNKNFTDHYLELPFDLSEVMFIATANTLDTLSAPLRDRLEIVELTGYTEAEKSQIARRHLVTKRSREAGIPEGVLNISDKALSSIIADYTREAGVRQLDRELMRISRRVALDVARAPKDSVLRVSIDESNVQEYLGKTRFHSDVAERTSIPGVATGLAWTPVGGDILFVETTRMPGKGRLEITGKLGDVMKESARAALSYTRSHAKELGISPEDLDRHDIHIHVPAGAVPKDGPSAGVTMFTALASLLTNRRVRPDTAMTGECTLRGRVLPVGGIKAKVLAAHRAGIRRIVLPERNQRDLDDVPQAIREDLEFVFAADMGDVLRAALEDGPPLIIEGAGFLAGVVSNEELQLKS
jgi:ATP-dependent Lon protease